MRSGCTAAERLALRQNAALERLLNPQLRQKPRRRTYHRRDPPTSSPPFSQRQAALPTPSNVEPSTLQTGYDVEMTSQESPRHPDFAFDTPGAGPSCLPGSTYAGLFQINDEPDEPEITLADAAPWLKGLSARAILERELEAEAARTGARKLDESDILTVCGFNFKVDTDISARAYEKLPRAFPPLRHLLSLKRTQSRAARLAGIKGVRIDCCTSSCMAFTGPFERMTECAYCGEARYEPDPTHPDRQRPRRTFQYIPLIPRLINMYLDPITANRLAYRATRQSPTGSFSDIFDGAHYQALLDQLVSINGVEQPHHFFSEPTDIALGLSCDGFGPFKSRTQSCWPLLAFNYNLPPTIRFQLEHVLCLGVIPGPSQPKDIGTFLEPFIDELEDLARGVPAFNGAHNHAFSLHAYLIACFGDMPAVAKLMCMKGHNGKSPCRACRIYGVRKHSQGKTSADSRTNYVPLSRPFAVGDHTPREYNPSHLPHRSHHEFIQQARQVQSAPNNTEEDRRARRFGINALSPLSRLSSLNFPHSFPHDFMHAVFENVLPTLIALWTHSRKFKHFGSGDEDYILDPEAWREIGEACTSSGDTIPAAFGCRIPNLSDERCRTTSESTLLFATLVGPALLRDRFPSKKYYVHYLKLVQLINLCLRFELSSQDVQVIREGFASWVVDYERLYYRHQAGRLRACTLPIHSLLHIADDINTMGPVWCYWAFPMERFCGALARANKSKLYPWSSLDRNVLEVAQLAQIKLIYGLADELNLDDRHDNLASGTRYNSYPDIVFVQPYRHESLSARLVRKVAKHLSIVVGANEKVVHQKLTNYPLALWGKMQQTDGHDIIRGYTLSPHTNRITRDASFVKYHSYFDRWDRDRPRELDETTTSYGRVEQFIVVDLDLVKDIASLTDDPHAFCTPIVLGVISPIRKFKMLSGSKLVQFTENANKLASAEIVNVEAIVGLVGRVRAPNGLWYIVDRATVIGRLDIMDSIADVA